MEFGPGNVFKNMGMTPWPESKRRVIAGYTFVEHPTQGLCSKCRTNYTAWVQKQESTGRLGPALCQVCQLDLACDCLTAKDAEIKLKGQQVQRFAEDVIRLTESEKNLRSREDILLRKVNDLERYKRNVESVQSANQDILNRIALLLWDSTSYTTSNILPYIVGLLEAKKKLDAIIALVNPPQPTAPLRQGDSKELWGGMLPKPKSFQQGTTNATGGNPLSALFTWGGEDLSLPKPRK